MDIVAEVQNTRNRVGGVYAWDYRGVSDAYSTTFLDKLIIIKNYVRISGGDNRELPIRGSLMEIIRGSRRKRKKGIVKTENYSFS